MASWHIDALDGRGGIAFASWREFALTEEEMELREAPCVAIMAPFFRPEPVATRALARSAPRGCFQIGVFAGEGEVAFTTLEAVTEFVRRVYIRAAGSDGLEGGGSPIPPAPDPEGGAPTLPELPPLKPIEDDIVRDGPLTLDLAKMVESFALASKELPSPEEGPVSGKPIRWLSKEHAPLEAPPRVKIGCQINAEDILGRAALILMHELLSRFPASSDASDLLRWQRAAKALGHLIGRLGLWGWLFDPVVFKNLVNWVDAIARSCGWPFQNSYPEAENFFDPSWRRSIILLLFGMSSSLDDEDWISQYHIFWQRRLTAPEMFYVTRISSVTLDELKLIPLPKRLASVVSATEHRPDVSLYHLLTSAIAAPKTLFSDPRSGTDAVNSLLFASCGMIFNEAETSSGCIATGPLTSIQRHQLTELLGYAWQWLAESLPRLALPHALEEMITEATSLRYVGGSNEESDPDPYQPSTSRNRREPRSMGQTRAAGAA